MPTYPALSVDDVWGQILKDYIDQSDAVRQPIDGDLTAIALLSTTSFGRALLELANAAAGRTALGLGTAATHAHGEYEVAGAAAAIVDSAPATLDTLNELAAALNDDANYAATITTALAGKQPLDSDLTSIAALTTTTFGRDLLTLANLAALKTLLALVGTDLSDYGTVTATQQTNDYTLALGDKGTVVEMDKATAVTLTIPLNATVAFPVGTVIEVYQKGAGQVTIAATGGVTLRAARGAKIAAQYGTAALRKRATDEFVLSGDTTS